MAAGAVGVGRPKESAAHRRARQQRQHARQVSHLAASLARLACHHGSALPKVLRGLAFQGQRTSASTTSASASTAFKSHSTAFGFGDKPNASTAASTKLPSVAIDASRVAEGAVSLAAATTASMSASAAGSAANSSMAVSKAAGEVPPGSHEQSWNKHAPEFKPASRLQEFSVSSAGCEGPQGAASHHSMIAATWMSSPPARRLTQRRASGEPGTPLTFNTDTGKLERKDKRLATPRLAPEPAAVSNSSDSGDELTGDGLWFDGGAVPEVAEISNHAAPSTVTNLRRCHFCSQLARKLLRCSRCRSVLYCSVDCQKKHWLSHRGVCVAAQISEPSVPDSPVHATAGSQLSDSSADQAKAREPREGDVAHWQSSWVPITAVRRPWAVFEEDVQDKMCDAADCAGAPVRLVKQWASLIEAIGAQAAFQTLSAEQQRAYAQVSLLELSAYECWRRAHGTADINEWDILDADAKGDYLPEDAVAMLATNPLWTTLIQSLGCV